jgi:membrane protease YdiL (CAAX protease family)
MGPGAALPQRAGRSRDLPVIKDDRGVSGFGALALLVLTVAMMYGLTFLFGAVYALLHDLPVLEATGRIQRDLALLTVIQLLAMGGTIAIGLRLFDPDSELPEALSLAPVNPATLGACIAAGLCLQWPLTELSNALHAHVFGPDSLEYQLALQNMTEPRSFGQGVLVVTSIAALVPAAEELLFRGLFLFGLQRRYGNGFALLVSSSFFGIVHGAPVPAVYATVAGLLLGTLALATRSVWPGIALHGAINAVPILLPERVLPIAGFNVPSETATHLPPWLVWPPLAIGLGLLALARRIEYASRA